MIFCEENLELQNFAEQVTQIQKAQYQQVMQLLAQQNLPIISELQAAEMTGMIFLQKSFLKTILPTKR